MEMYTNIYEITHLTLFPFPILHALSSPPDAAFQRLIPASLKQKLRQELFYSGPNAVRSSIRYTKVEKISISISLIYWLEI